jgi:glycosyltransferase involved in cell wall biosynthesis
VSRRVLLLSPGVPLPTWGSGTRIHQLARHLSSDHEVTVLSYADPSEEALVDPLRDVCREVRLVPNRSDGPISRRARQVRSTVSRDPFLARELRSNQMQAALDSMLAEQRFDIVQIESSQMTCFRLHTNARVVLDEHNIEYELLGRMHEGERSAVRRAHNRVEERKVRHYERLWWGRVDGVAVPSHREELIVRREAPGTLTAVVPNSVDVEYFAPGNDEAEDQQIIFTGLLTYRPNLDAAIHLVDNILPRIRKRHPGVALTIVGGGREADLDALRRPGVTVTGWVRDVRPYVRRASVVVAPLRIGSGTRLKVVEGLAMAKPMVSTTIGCEGIDVNSGEHLLVADSPDEFADAVALLLRDRALGQRLGAAGHRLARDHYSWEGAAENLATLYDSLTPVHAKRGGRSK